MYSAHIEGALNAVADILNICTAPHAYDCCGPVHFCLPFTLSPPACMPCHSPLPFFSEQQSICQTARPQVRLGPTSSSVGYPFGGGASCEQAQSLHAPAALLMAWFQRGGVLSLAAALVGIIATAQVFARDPRCPAAIRTVVARLLCSQRC